LHHSGSYGDGVVNAVRYGLPALIAAAGVLIALIGSSSALDALGGSLVCAALVVLLINLFMRLSISSNRDREREEQARAYFDRHGHWPGPGEL
jgi:hypothetical protein